MSSATIFQAPPYDPGRDRREVGETDVGEAAGLLRERLRLRCAHEGARAGHRLIVAVGGGGLIGMLLMAILAPFAAMLVQMAISRSREYEADASGARLCHRASGLEHALEKLDVASRQEPLNATPATAHLFIVNPLTGGGFATLFSTHPPIEERIARLRAMKL